MPAGGHWGPIAVGLLMAGGHAAPAAGQSNDSTTFLNGVVIDAVTANEMPGVLVRLGETRAVLTDDSGVFEIAPLPLGPHVLSISQFGYETQVIDVELPLSANAFLQIALQPKPYSIEGVNVVADRFASIEQALHNRRARVAVGVITLGQERLVSSTATDAREFLLEEASITLVPCPTSRRSTGMPVGECVMRRNRPAVGLQVCIDEIPVSGLHELATYDPKDLYLMEVYNSGLQVRVYTRWFIEGMLERPRPLATAASYQC
jgi:hypothetical protein